MAFISEKVRVTTEQAHYLTHISAGSHTLIADEPVADGGTDAGPGPFQYLLASLGSCTSITLRMYADRKGWPLERIEVALQLEDLPGEGSKKNTRIHRAITLTGLLTAEQRDRLLQIANACPVHKILTGNIAVETVLE